MQSGEKQGKHSPARLGPLKTFTMDHLQAGENILASVSCQTRVENFGTVSGQLIATDQRLVFLGLPMREWPWSELSTGQLEIDEFAGQLCLYTAGEIEEAYLHLSGDTKDIFEMGRVVGKKITQLRICIPSPIDIGCFD